MIVVIDAPDFVIPRVVSKWAIFGPVFIPILHPLGGRAADGARRLPLGPGSPMTS
jgi:p-aminobenzoyl-glutamate transporter AbgT